MFTLMAAMLSSSLVMSAPPRAPHVLPPDAKTIYNTNCRKCHGVTGAASPSMKRMMPKLPNLDAKFMGTLSTQEVVTAIGKGKGDMKPFADKLSADEINAVAAYVFELAGAKPKGK